MPKQSSPTTISCHCEYLHSAAPLIVGQTVSLTGLSTAQRSSGQPKRSDAIYLPMLSVIMSPLLLRAVVSEATQSTPARRSISGLQSSALQIFDVLSLILLFCAFPIDGWQPLSAFGQLLV
jgi:hypothetical protein